MQKFKTLFGSILILLSLGSVYAWSLFNSPLAQQFGLEVNTVAFTFGIMTLFIATGSLCSGFLKLRLGINNVIVLSSVCIGIGLLISAFAPNLVILFLAAGVLLGFGDGLGYMLVLTNCVKFFPNHKGLTSALCIGAYGAGSLIFKSIDEYMLVNYGTQSALMCWGLICASAAALGSLLVFDAMKQKDIAQSASASPREYELRHSIRTLPYWLLALMFLIDCMCGLYIIGAAANLGSTVASLDAADAAFCVSIAALANIAGRLIMGVLSDRLPRIRLITFDQALSLAAMLMLLLLPQSKWLFYGAVSLVAFSFGGTLTIYPSIISDFFGIKNLAKNYGLLYLGFGLGSMVGYATAIVFNSYVVTFALMAVCLVAAIVLSLMVRLPPELRHGHTQLKQENLVP